MGSGDDLFAELIVDDHRYELRRGAGENVTLSADGWKTKLSMPWFCPLSGFLWPEGELLRVVASGFHCKDDHTEEFTWRVTRDGKLLRDDARAELAHAGQVYSVVPAGDRLILRGGQGQSWELALETPGHRPGWPSLSADGRELRIWVTGVDNRTLRCSVFRWRVGTDGNVREATRGDFSRDLLADWRDLPQREAILALLQPIVQEVCAKDADYPGSQEIAPRLEVFAAFADRWQTTVHFLFHHRRWCMAQSGSDFEMFYAHAGSARIVGGRVVAQAIGARVTDLLTEEAAEEFDDEAAAAIVRARCIAELRLPS